MTLVDEVMVRVLEANPEHVYNKFMMPNVGSFVRVGDKSGTLTGATGNKDLFKFGLTIKNDDDYGSIKVTDEEGNFILDKEFCGIHGITESIGLYDVSMEDYAFLKQEMDRLDIEAKWYYSKIKEMKENGFELPPAPPQEYIKTEKKGLTVPAFHVELDYDQDYTFEVEFEESNETLLSFNKRRNKIIHSIKKGIHSIVRCIEYGFYETNQHLEESLEFDFKLPNKKIKWNRLENVIDGVDIRYREFTKKI